MMNKVLPVSNPQGNDAQMLDALRRETFEYFRTEFNPRNGLIADKTQPESPASIAAVGMGLSVYVVAVERGWLKRAEAVGRILTLLRFFRSSRQGAAADASGYKGFYYHFLDMRTGARVWQCELSTIDTAILMAGVLTVASYFQGTSGAETEIRELAEILYLRIDWKWALNGGKTICHGWSPEFGFLPCRWDTGYSEALILYMLALGCDVTQVHPSHCSAAGRPGGRSRHRTVHTPDAHRGISGKRCRSRNRSRRTGWDSLRGHPGGSSVLLKGLQSWSGFLYAARGAVNDMHPSCWA